jgi:hypothetical protein
LALVSPIGSDQIAKNRFTVFGMALQRHLVSRTAMLWLVVAQLPEG